MNVNYDSRLRDICDCCDMSLTQIYYGLKIPIENLRFNLDIDGQLINSALNFLDEIRFADLGLLILHDIVQLNPTSQVHALQNIEFLLPYCNDVPELENINMWIAQVMELTTHFVRY